MLQKKICMLGSFAVGKTSLVRRYVDSVFSENYITTIGVKIDKKTVAVSGTVVSLLMWDVYGEDNHQSVLPSYLRGMSGYLLVVDPTRPNTYSRATKLQELVQSTIGSRPFILVKNKYDLVNDWKTDNNDELQSLESSAYSVIETSAKTDHGVNEMFESLATAVCQSN